MIQNQLTLGSFGAAMEKRRKKRVRRILATGISCSLIFTTISGLAVLAPISVYAANPIQVGAAILSLLTTLNQTPSTTSITNYMSNNSVLSQTITSVEQLEGLDTAINTALSSDISSARLTAQLSDSSTDMTILKETLIGAGADPEKVRLLSSNGATVGENVKATIKEYLETGELSRSYGGKTLNEIGLETAFGMTALAYEGAKLGNFQQFQEYAQAAGLTQSEIDAAVDSGAAFGDPSAFADYIQEYRKTIASATDISANSTVLNALPAGNRMVSYISGDIYGQTFYTYLYLQPGIYAYISRTSGYGGYVLRVANLSNTRAGGSVAYRGNGNTNPNLIPDSAFGLDPDSITGWGIGDIRYMKYLTPGVPILTNVDPSLSEVFPNGAPASKSPSITGSGGQLTSSVDPSQNTQPYIINVSPIYNVNNYNMNPIPSLQDYSGVVGQLEENVSENISNENITPSFIQPYLVPRQVVDPDPEPTGAPNPTTTPIPSIIPPQPTAAPLPTLAPEDETEVPKYMNQPDLTSKFPFCIPFDLALIFALFSSDIRQAPVFDWELNFGPAGTYNIHIDFSPYDPAAALFRLLMLIFFVFSLALGTHRLVHPEGP